MSKEKYWGLAEKAEEKYRLSRIIYNG